MRWFIILLLACAAHLSLLPRTAHADGKLLSRSQAVVRIPDQQALIVWHNDEQTLVVETRFEHHADTPDSDEASYAWLIPIPGDGAREGFTPRVLEATPGLFPTLRNIFRPRIERSSDIPWMIVFLFSLVILAAALSRTKVWPRLLLVFSILTLFVLFMLPALGTARASLAGDGVLIYERSLVGAYDVAVLGAGDASGTTNAAAVRDWLNANGFRTPPGVDDVMDAYTRDGWLFVAAKVHADLQARASTSAGTSTDALTPHPLAVRFRTAHPVYPLRLTGVGNGPLGVDLYIFGPGQAAAPGLRVERSDTPVIPTADQLLEMRHSHPHTPPGSIRVAHAGLRALLPLDTSAQPPLVATKLSGTLSPRQMQRDAPITWRPGASPVGGSAFSPRGAVERATAAACISLLACAAYLAFYVTLRPNTHRTVAAAWSLGLAFAAYIIVLLITPTVRITTREEVRRDIIGLSDFSRRLYDALQETPEPLDATRAMDIAQHLRRTIADDEGQPAKPGPGPGFGPAPGDGPGDFALRLTPDGLLEFITHRADGSEHVAWVLNATPNPR
ncbi:MAG: DUF2330 domain-containing protein [Phycisphaeraceae bacterium]|nr:DUF2330 domain-containing protein [Phycisphaeraceae bacterium]